MKKRIINILVERGYFYFKLLYLFTFLKGVAGSNSCFLVAIKIVYLYKLIKLLFLFDINFIF